MLNERHNALRGTWREPASLSLVFGANEPQSMFRAFQTAPLLRLASNETGQAHVRTFAALGENQAIAGGGQIGALTAMKKDAAAKCYGAARVQAFRRGQNASTAWKG